MQRKLAESEYYDGYTRNRGRYEVHPEKEYRRILLESGILSEKHCLTLDLGCGTGAFGLRLARIGFQMLGIDISPNAIRLASKIAREQGLDADFVVGDIEKMPFQDSAFQFVFCGFVLHHVPHMLPQVLQQINHVVQDDGKIFLCEPNAHNLSCVVQYNLGKCRTPNEKPIDTKQLTTLLSATGFGCIRFKDIGDVEHLQTDSPSRLRNALRQVARIILRSANKAPLIPGAYFVMEATKKRTDNSVTKSAKLF